ncbi:MAG: hypothetical protein Q8P67_04910 [archaeon]|nr:hypothetical protein [archaeon]
MTDTGSSTPLPDDEQPEEHSQDLLFQYSDDLEDRTAEKRLKALQNCATTIALHYLSEGVESFRATLLSAVENSLKRGGAPEKVSAFSLLRLVVVTLGTSSQGIFPAFRPACLRLLGDRDEDVEVRAAAAHTLALLSFICEESEETSHDDAAVLQTLFEEPEALSAAAVNGLALMLTVMSATTIIERYLEDVLLALFELLTRSPPATSVAAGEAIAYLYEVARGADDYDLEDLPVDSNEVVAVLNEMAVERTRRKAKSDQKDQRKNFRNILASVEKNTPPSVELIVNKQQVSFGSWEEVIQLNALKLTLRSGFQIHFQHNDLLHQIFDVRIQKETSKYKLSKLEKRQFCSKNSAASKDRMARRDASRSKKIVK